uniref:hypothetical protein n=1 Tax=Dermacoccus nishinomiyaensis TaxID=1274 RepID=UPI0036F3E75E
EVRVEGSGEQVIGGTGTVLGGKRFGLGKGRGELEVASEGGMVGERGKEMGGRAGREMGVGGRWEWGWLGLMVSG